MPAMPEFATVDPFAGMTGKAPGKVQNLLAGRWQDTNAVRDDIPDPMTGEAFLQVPDTEDYSGFIDGLRSCPKTGLHNPGPPPRLLNPRYRTISRD